MADKTDFGPRLGADPELFLIAKKGKEFNKNTIVPVCGHIGGSKERPIVVPLEALKGYIEKDPKGIGDYAFQEDNVAFEFNVQAVSHPDYFRHNIFGFMRYLETTILANQNFIFANINKYKFPEKFLQHPLAHVIGCSPDFCAYLPKNQQMRRPLMVEDLGFQRFCGGHFHVQYNYNNVPQDIFAKFMDVVVSLAFLALDKQGDRRKFYGQAGIYRPKPYGIEYRTSSNFWLDPKHDERETAKYIARNIFNLAHEANERSDSLAEAYRRIPWPDVETAINKEDLKLAGDIITHVNRSVFPFPIFHSRNGAIRSAA